VSELLARYSQREKVILALALLVAIVVGLHAFIVEPYLLRIVELQDEIEQQRDDLDWMRSAITRLPAGESSAAAVSIKGTLANFIDQAVRRQGLSEKLTQMSPVGADQVRMRYKSVDFNRLISFIAQVKANGLDVADMRISPGDNPGIVDSNIVLVRR